MGHAADVCQSTSRDNSGSYCDGDSEVQVTRHVTDALRWLQRGIETRSGTSSKGPCTGSRPHGGLQPDWPWNRHVPRRPVKLRET
jgi:hypothetical protein